MSKKNRIVVTQVTSFGQMICVIIESLDAFNFCVSQPVDLGNPVVCQLQSPLASKPQNGLAEILDDRAEIFSLALQLYL